MKRDMDLARTILLAVEELPYDETGSILRIPDRPDDEVTYHVKLLADAGLIEAREFAYGESGSDWMPISLTWQGHEFLDAARDNTRWNKAKATAMQKAGTLTFDLLKAILADLVKKVLLPDTQ